jgi:N-methylhydantoinase B
VLRAPGAGGYGPARDRDPARLAADVVDGYVSPAAAVHVYAAASAARCPACADSRPRSDGAART